MMEDKYTFATIILLASFKCSALMAIENDLKDEKGFKSNPKTTMQISPVANLYQLPEPLKVKRPTKEEMLAKIIQNSDPHKWPPVRFITPDDEIISKNIGDLFSDGRWEYLGS